MQKSLRLWPHCVPVYRELGQQYPSAGGNSTLVHQQSGRTKLDCACRQLHVHTACARLKLMIRGTTGPTSRYIYSKHGSDDSSCSGLACA
jgi:hypothetical protein